MGRRNLKGRMNKVTSWSFRRKSLVNKWLKIIYEQTTSPKSPETGFDNIFLGNDLGSKPLDGAIVYHDPLNYF